MANFRDAERGKSQLRFNAFIRTANGQAGPKVSETFFDSAPPPPPPPPSGATPLRMLMGVGT